MDALIGGTEITQLPNLEGVREAFGPAALVVPDQIIGYTHGREHTHFDAACYGGFNGPRLETASEIRRLALDGCDLVGQTGMPEAALAAELAATRAAAMRRVANILLAFAAQPTTARQPPRA